MANIVPFPRKHHTGLKGEFVPPVNVYHAVWEVEADGAEDFAALLDALNDIEGVSNLEFKRSA